MRPKWSRHRRAIGVVRAAKDPRAGNERCPVTRREARTGGSGQRIDGSVTGRGGAAKLYLLATTLGHMSSAGARQMPLTDCRLAVSGRLGAVGILRFGSTVLKESTSFRPF
jgi:hypothetical protein